MKDDSWHGTQVTRMVLCLKAKVALHIDLDGGIHPAEPGADLGNVLTHKCELPCWICHGRTDIIYTQVPKTQCQNKTMSLHITRLPQDIVKAIIGFRLDEHDDYQHFSDWRLLCLEPTTQQREENKLEKDLRKVFEETLIMTQLQIYSYVESVYLKHPHKFQDLSWRKEIMIHFQEVYTAHVTITLHEDLLAKVCNWILENEDKQVAEFIKTKFQSLWGIHTGEDIADCREGLKFRQAEIERMCETAL